MGHKTALLNRPVKVNCTGEMEFRFVACNFSCIAYGTEKLLEFREVIKLMEYSVKAVFEIKINTFKINALLATEDVYTAERGPPTLKL